MSQSGGFREQHVQRYGSESAYQSEQSVCRFRYHVRTATGADGIPISPGESTLCEMTLSAAILSEHLCAPRVREVMARGSGVVPRMRQIAGLSTRLVVCLQLACGAAAGLGTLGDLAFAGIAGPMRAGAPCWQHLGMLRRTCIDPHAIRRPKDTATLRLPVQGMGGHLGDRKLALSCVPSDRESEAESPGEVDVIRGDIEKSKEFWLALAEERLAVIREEKAASDPVPASEEQAKVGSILSQLQKDILPPFFPAGKTYSEAEAKDLVEQARSRLDETFAAIDRRTQVTLGRVLKAFRDKRVGPHLFTPTDGYGHGDMGRETLDEIYADLFGAEQAIVRVQCFSGTHAIACALFAVLRPGDEMLAISGPPYDTLEEVIGSRKEDPELVDKGLTGSLDDFGVTYEQESPFCHRPRLCLPPG